MKVLIFALLIVIASAQLSKVIPQIEQDGAALKQLLVEDFKQLIAAKKQFKADLIKLMQFEHTLKQQAEDFLPKPVNDKVPIELQSLYQIHVDWKKVGHDAGKVGDVLLHICEAVCDDLLDG